MFERSTLKTLSARIKENRRFIQVLMGPRQVGKTTLVSQMLAHLKVDNLFEIGQGIPPTYRGLLLFLKHGDSFRKIYCRPWQPGSDISYRS